VPSAACHTVLGKAAARGARLHWRANFDWAGLRIVGAAMTRHAARPWRMSARDHRDALAAGESTPLAGPQTDTPGTRASRRSWPNTAAPSWKNA
jgi:hypothetical protein